MNGMRTRNGRMNPVLVYFFLLFAPIGFTGCKTKPKAIEQNELKTAAVTNPQRAVPLPEESCRAFVQEFYNWYVGVDHGKHAERTDVDVVLKQRPDSLSPVLWRALKEDSEAQGKAHEIVGLDFDPFFDSQDPSSKFVVKSVVVKDDDCRALVWGTEDGAKREEVIPELKLTGSIWKIANVHYKSEDTGNENLLSILAYMKKDRQKQ